MNKYKEIKTLGKGSFGRAVLVEELSTGKEFVMKIIEVSAMKPQEREEAVEEAKILEKLEHPNITAYKESFTDSKYLYIVMEYCNGGDLHDLIKAEKLRGQLFDENTIWDYFLEACLAVKHIHDRRILHRDLKTQNIFISNSNGRKMMKIGDFGVSKILSSTMECARTAIGTPYYLSPELCNNQGYNNKSDIWALGCILYELCTLNHTFEAANMKMLIVKILEGRYQPISSKYSPQLKDVITMMLEKDPKKRPNINTLLKQPFLMAKVKQLLTYCDQTVLEDEFSHTVFHGKGNLLKGFQEQGVGARDAANPFLQNKAGEAPAREQQQPNQIFRNYPAAQKREPTPPQQSGTPRGYPQNVAPISHAKENQVQAAVRQRQELARQERMKAEQLVINQARNQPSYPSNVKPFAGQPSQPPARQQPFGAQPKGAPPAKTPKSNQPIPSADTLANKFNELNNYVNGAQPQEPFDHQQPPASHYPTNVQTPQAKGAIGGMFNYNPPQNIVYPSNLPQNQPTSNNAREQQHQKEVIRQLAPMSDKDKIRYQREKELQEKRQKALQLQQEHQEKLAAQQREREQKYAELNRKYEEQMAIKKLAAAKAEEQAKADEERQKQIAEQKKQQDKEEQERRNREAQERAAAQRQKQDADREKMREFIAQKKAMIAQAGGKSGIEIQIAGAAPEPAAKTPSKRPRSEPKIEQIDDDSSDFGDQPDQAMRRANDKDDEAVNKAEEWKRKLSDKSSKDSLCYRMESLRAFLEKELGFTNFVNVYSSLQEANANDHEDYDQNRVNKILGEDRMGYLNVIVELILVEQDFNEAE